MIYGVGGGVGGCTYHIGIPKVKPKKLRVTKTILLTMPEGGNRKEIVCMGIIHNNPLRSLILVAIKVVNRSGYYKI